MNSSTSASRSPTLALFKHITQQKTVTQGINSIALDTKRKKILIRTDSYQMPLIAYDYQGNVLQKITASSIVTDEEYRGVAIDTKRELYLIAVRGGVLRVDYSGKTRDVLYVCGHVQGIAYMGDEDVYVVTVTLCGKVQKIHPETGDVLLTFPAQFSCPWDVTTYTKQSACGDTTYVAVTDQDDKCARVFTPQGDPVHTLGDGVLQCPWGVTVDPQGRILVGDCDKIITFEVDSGASSEFDTQTAGCGEEEASFLRCDQQEGILVVGAYRKFAIIKLADENFNWDKTTSHEDLD